MRHIKILNPYRSRQSSGRCFWCNFDTTPLPPGRAGRDGFVKRKLFAGRVVPKKTIADTAEKNSLCQNKSAVCNCTSIASRKRGYLIFISRKRTDYILLRNHQASARKGRGFSCLGGLGLGIIRRNQKQAGSYLTAMASISHSTFLGESFYSNTTAGGIGRKIIRMEGLCPDKFAFASAAQQ